MPGSRPQVICTRGAGACQRAYWGMETRRWMSRSPSSYASQPLILQPLFCCNCVLQVLALCHIKTFTRRAVKDAQVRFAQLFRPSRKINRGLE
jgi:hypothetical protein